MITIGAKYDGEVIIDTRIRTESAIQKLMTLQNKMKKTASEVEILTSKMEKLEKAKMPTEEYREVQKQIERTRAKQSALNERMEEWVELGKSTKSNTFKTMRREAVQLENTMSYLQGEAQEMRDLGTAFADPTQSANYQRMVAQQQYLNGQQAIYKHQWQEIVNKEIQANQEATKTVTKFEKLKNAVSKIGSGLKNAVNRIKKMHSGTKKTNNGFKNILRTMKQMMLSMAVFQIMFKGLEYVTSGLKNLAVYSEEYNKTMSDFTSATAQLKNGLAVAFQPILNMVIPALTSMVNYLNDAANAVSRFFSIMAGKSTYTKAIKQNKDYAASLDKVGDSSEEAKGSLAGFDDLNVLQKKNESGSSSSDGADGSGFVEEVVGEPTDWAKSFKEAIEAGDWYGVGALLAEKVNNAIQMAFDFLSSIDWTEKGQALASGINGWVSNVDWVLFGQTLSEGFIGLLTFTVEFVRTLDFGEIGRAFGELLANIDWWGIIMNLGTLIWEAICGLWDFLCGLVDGLGIVDAVKGIMDDIRDWIEKKMAAIGIGLIVAYIALKKGWDDFWQGLWDSLKGVINNIIGGVEEMVNSVISGINGMINALNNLSFSVPDWVPVIGGGTFGLSIPTLSTINSPRLANGGITTGSTLANIGEAGKEVVLPLERNTEWADILADKINTRGGETRVIVELDGKVVYNNVVKHDREHIKRTGSSSFAY